MRNPYTNVPMDLHVSPFRRPGDWGFFAVMVLGILYVFAYVWPWWPWSPRLNNSGQAVGFLYFFLGGYAFLRSGWQREHHNAGANAWFAWILLPVAVWDMMSAFVLQDFHPVSIGAHVLGGAVALAASLIALRGARRESVTEPTVT